MGEHLHCNVSYNLIRTKSGKQLTFDTSKKASRIFGFYPGNRVQTPRGDAIGLAVHNSQLTVTVIGVCNGSLWFHIDGDAGCTYWDNGTGYEELLAIGILLLNE